MASALKAPTNLHIDFRPSEKQYEVWKSLQPECPECGGQVTQVECGRDRNNQPLYKAMCQKCGNENIPQVILEGGAAGGGKAGLLDSTVCTPFGFRKVRDLHVGDIITNPNTGGMQKIIWLHPIETHNYYRVHFIDGTYFDCSEGHLWQCHESRKKLKRSIFNGISTDTVWRTKDMFDWYERKKSGMYKGHSLIIPLTKPVQFTIGRNKGKIDPYVIGALIGNGRITLSTNSIHFTNIDTEIADEFVRCGYDMNRVTNKQKAQAKCYVLSDNTLVAEIVKMGLDRSATNKFIPRSYQFATIEDRIRLIQGLMDTDGYVDSKGNMSFTTISQQLADDFAFVVRSLGGVVTIKKNEASYRKNDVKIKCSDAYTVHFRSSINTQLCLLSRKRNLCKDRFNGGNSELGKRITDIECIGPKEGRCITVDDPSGLYVADNFTVTHNSYLGACWLISSCIRWADIRAVVARLTLKSLRESTWNTILSILSQWGLEENVNYRIDNLHGELVFWNKSKIIMKELADTNIDPDFQRLGSSEYTMAFVDEVGQISSKAIDVLGSRIRWKVESTTIVPKLLMSTNPCLGWIRDRFVMDENGDEVVCALHDKYIPFSVFDNPDESFRRAYLVALDNIKDQATKERLKYGNWNWIDSNEAAAYWNFDGNKHLMTDLKQKNYNPLNPIILSWDFNVMPYMSTLSLQIDYDRKKVYVLEENLGKPDDKTNNTPTLARTLANKFLNEKHIGGLFITGDPAGLARSTMTEDGVNNFTIIMGNMALPGLHLEKRLLSKQPSQKLRLEFINALFNRYDGWELLIDMKCRKLTEDLVYQTKNADGTKCKKRSTDPKSGVKFEKYGHLSDCLDYALCLFLPDAWSHFQRKSSHIETTDNIVYGGFEY